MFTGIVEELGRFLSADGERYRFEAEVVLEGSELGASIACNGCCLTLVDQGEGWWEADVSDETLSRTALGDLQPEDPMNFERPVRLADRLGGHLVQGHVDAVGVVSHPAPDLRVDAPPEVVKYLVEKGSITVDGVSLTVVDVDDDGFTVALIPHTCDVTTLGARGVGDRVNLEVDVVAKYVERLVSPHHGGSPTDAERSVQR
ncbi:MAG: riboflavin synthase [Actinomycetota bacterium]|jgi:riboflavin synthase|nr:riboflavin synthase [Actinomycetota bacterium]